jgi:hypothetical protein
MDRWGSGAEDPEMEGIPTDYDQLEVSEWGLDWGDVSQIRDKLRLTPTERLKAAQDSSTPSFGSAPRMATELRIDEVLRVLSRNGVQFILVGGVAAILHGSPLTTEDIDIVYLASEQNSLCLARA